MNDERAHRVGLNEAVFREVNERLGELHDQFELSGNLDIVCECGQLSCSERLSVPRSEYEAVRANPHLFLIAPGHETHEVEQVVRTTDSYHVIEKGAGTPRRVAEETDPRGR
jgi:hypothetical protein